MYRFKKRSFHPFCHTVLFGIFWHDEFVWNSFFEMFQIFSMYILLHCLYARFSVFCQSIFPPLIPIQEIVKILHFSALRHTPRHIWFCHHGILTCIQPHSVIFYSFFHKHRYELGLVALKLSYFYLLEICFYDACLLHMAHRN